MTTPKELADKARAYLLPYRHAPKDMLPELRDEFHATINQLKAMAEARQSSGEPVALREVGLTRDVNGMCVVTVNGREAIRDNGDVISHFATPDWFAPPSAGNRTHIADLIDTFEQLRKIVGTPEQDADALIAAVRTLAAPPSAQQATGSGQVLTDEPCDCGCLTPTFTEPLEALRFLSARFKYAGVNEAVAKDYARDIDAILAAATQAQPEALDRVWSDADMAHTYATEFCPYKGAPDPWTVWQAAWAACFKQAQAQVAAPTTGKREPLTNRLIEKMPVWRPFLGLQPEHRQEIVRAVERAHGITGEQR